MPVCKFFLEGLCTREDCPYLHTKVLDAFLFRLPQMISPRCPLKLLSAPPSSVAIVPMGLIAGRGDRTKYVLTRDDPYNAYETT